MADRVGDENAEPDVTETRLPRRSSILKPVRPVLESVENATEDLTERRRLSKRVSFSDTHQIKLFKCEISDEHSSGGESASQAGLVFLPGNTTQSDHAVEDPVGEAVQLLQFHHTPLEQSFYLAANEGSGNTEAASPTKTTSVLMEEAHSCLVFTQHGNISEAPDVSSYQPFLDGTLGHSTMDITCGGTVNQTVAEATKTMLDNKTMETTSIETTSHNQSALASFKTTLGDRSMDMTRVCGTSVLEQTITSMHRTHVISDTGMDVTVGPQDTVTGGDATVRLQQTMNMTCPVGSTSFATGASDEVDAGVVPSGEAAKGNCAIASPSGMFDIAAFVASNRKHDCAELLGSKPGELESGRTDTSPATAAQKIEPFNLAAFVSLNRRNDPSEIIGKAAKCILEPASTQPAPVPWETSLSDQGNVDMKGAMKEIDTPGVVCTNGNLTSAIGQFDIAAFVATNRRNDACMLMGGHAESTGMAPMLPSPRAPAFHSATSFRAGYKSAQKFTREADNTHLSSMETSATTDYRAVTMNVTDLDMTTGPEADLGTESSEPALTLQNRTIMTDVMSMTCAGFPGPEATLNDVRESDNVHLSPMETSLATDYRVVTMNVTGLDITPEPAIHTGTESSVPAVTLQNRTVMTDVMNMTCADLLGSEGIQNVARENNSTRLSPVQTSVATACQVVTMNVTGLNTTTGLTVGAETSPIATLQDRTLMADVMSMTCADLLGSEGIQNATRKSNSMCLSPVQASLATDYQVVTTNVTGLSTTTGLTVGTDTAPIATLQDRTVMTNVMNITCDDLLGLEEPSRENHPCAKPAESTLHYRDGDLSAAMNITCPNTMECPLIDEGTTGPSTELNEQVYVSPGVVEKSHYVTGEHSLNQADSQGEELSVAAHSHVESNRDDVNDASEYMRLDPRLSMISLNATARDKSGADFSRSMPFLHTPASFAASLDDSSEAVPQDLPVLCDVTAPSLLKATPEDKPAGNIRSVERSTSPTTPPKGKSHTSVKDSARKQFSVQASPADVLKGKDSVAYQLLASPAAKRSLQSVGPTLRATVAPPSIKKQNATLKVDLTAPANMFNSLTDSTVNVSNVSALLEMPTGYVSSLTLLDDVFSPEMVGKGNTDARNESACGSKSLTKARQQMGSVSHSRLVCNQGQSITVSSEVRANLDKTIAQEAADARQDQAVASHSSKKSSLAAVSSASITKFNRESLSKSLSTTRRKRPMGTLETVVGHCPQSEVTTSSPGISSRAASAADAQCVGASLLACKNDESVPKRATLMASDVAIRDNSTLVAADVSVQERVTLVAGDASARKSGTHIVNDAPIRKSATFVVSRAPTRKSSTFLATSGNGARPSATFAVSPPDYSIVQINDGTTVDESNRDAPSSMKVHSSATRVRSVKHSTAAVHQPENSCSNQGATVSRSRKRLQFTAVDLQTSQSTMEGMGLHANGCAENGHENMPAVPVASKGLFDVSRIQALPNPGETSSHQLHATSCRVLQRSTGSRVDDGDMLTDVPEPFLVGNNSTTSSSADSQHPSRSFETASQQTCHTENSKPTGAVLKSPDANVCIPINMFYSSSSKKRSKLPSTPSARSSEKCRSTAKKRRPKQAAAKGSGSKRHICSPVPTSTKRRRPLQLQNTNSKAESVRKAAVSATSASKTRQRIERTGSSVMDILRSVFSYQPKLRSLPPSPVASSTPTNASSPPVELPDSSVLLEEFNVPDDLSPQSTLKALDAVQARITRRLGEIAGSRAEGNPSSSVKDCVVADIPPYELSDPQLDLTANIDILGIIDRLDDTNIRETLYWSFYNIPEETRKHWELYECVLEADRAAFGFIKGRVKLLVWLGDYVKLPNSGDRLTLARAAASGEVRHRAKVITRLRYKVTCRRKAQFNQYILQRLQDEHKADELLKKYPTTDCLGKLLEELGRFIVRYRPLSRDIAIIASDHRHTFRHPVLSYQIVAPSRLIWFHLDLPIDVDVYPNAVIVPSMRPYSDEYSVITTEKLRRITARVEPGPEYIVRLVDEIDNFLKK